MKKFLSMISTFVLTVLCVLGLAACSDGVKAEDLLNNIIIPNEGSAVTKNFGVPGKLKKKDKEYSLTWTSNNDCLKVAQEIDDKNQFIISVVRPEDERQEVTLTATVNGLKGQKDFKFFVSPYDVYDFSQAYNFNLEGKNLYGEYGLDTEMALPGAKEKATIEWSTKSNMITIDNANKKMTVKLSFDKIVTSLIAKFTYKGVSTEVEYKVNVLQQDVFTPVSELKDNTEYVLGLLQVNLDNEYLWMNGAIEDKKRGQTTNDLKKAAHVYVTKLENGNYHLWYKSGEAKKYFTSTGDRVLSFTDNPETEWTWDAEHKTLLDPKKNFLGTYNQFNNISLSEYSHIGDNFIAQFYTKADIAAATPDFDAATKMEYEVRSFKMYDLNPGETKLQTEGKKFKDVKISYELAANDNVTLNIEKNVLDVKEIAEEATCKLTVTFTLGEMVESKDVELKIKATVTKTLAEIYELKDYTPVHVRGIVVARDKDGIVIQDETGSMYVRTKDSCWTNQPKKGNIAEFVAIKRSNYGAAQLNPAMKTYDSKSYDGSIIKPEATVFTKTELEESLKGAPIYQEITFEAVVSAGKYLEATIDGTTKKFSLKGEDKDLAPVIKANGLTGKFTGYISGSNTKVGYITVMINSFEVTEKDDQKIVDAVKNQISSKLPTEEVMIPTDITLYADYGVALEATPTGNITAIKDEKTGNITLSINPLDTATSASLKIKITKGEKSAELEVTIKSKKANADIFEFSVDYNKTATAIEDGVKFVQGFATIEQVKNTSGTAVATKYAEMRVYAGHKLTITSDKKIAKIVFNTASDKKFSTLEADSGKIVVDGATATWSGSANSVVISNTGSRGRVVKCYVIYE